jgi:hypothetical protein
MRTLVITLLLVSFTNTTYCQKSMATDLEKENIKSTELPDINNAYSDIYLPDEHPDAAIRELEQKFKNHSIPKKDKEGSLNTLTMQIERGIIVADYDTNHKLIGVNETYKKVKLPNTIVAAVQKEFPGWLITDSTYFYSQKNGVVTKKQYKLKIENQNDKRNIVVYADGQIKK